MHTQTFAATESPRIVVTGGEGNLIVETWDETGIALESSTRIDAAAEQDVELIVHGARGELRLRVPPAAAIEVEDHRGDVRIALAGGSVQLREIYGVTSVGGAAVLTIRADRQPRPRDARLSRVRRDVEAHEIGTAEIAEVRGNLTMQTVRQAAVGAVGGDAALRDVVGDLRVGDVGGGCAMADVAGDLAVGAVGGSCTVEAVSGTVRAGAIGGNATFHATGPILSLGSVGGDLTIEGAPFEILSETRRAAPVTVGGNARIALPEQPNQSISAIVGGTVRDRNGVRGGGVRTIVYGDGAARLSMTVGGDLTLA